MPAKRTPKPHRLLQLPNQEEPEMPEAIEYERLHCLNCGKSVSTPVPKDTIVRAWIQCPECIEKYEGLAIGNVKATTKGEPA